MALGDFSRNMSPILHRFVRPVIVLALGLSGSCNAADWPQWRGLARDGHTSEALPATLVPPTAAQWHHPIGHGYASPAISSGKVFILDDANGIETLHCLAIGTGQEHWQKPIAESYTDEFEPGPRCTPLVDGPFVFVQTCRGEFQ